jgi:hypothetical protein
VYAGHRLLATQIESAPGGPSPVDALAIETGDNQPPFVYLVNRTDRPVTITYVGAAAIQTVSLAPYRFRRIGK